MAVPADLVETEPDRAELMIALPSWWQFESEDENWRWPLRWLKIMTRLPWNQHTWLGWGDTVPRSHPAHTGAGHAGILLIHPQAYGAESFHCTLPNGEQVEFYQMVPLYADELDFKLRNGAEALLRYMNEEALEVVDPARESACRYVSVKDFAIPSAQIRPMLRNWKGPAGCIATDRILVDGCGWDICIGKCRTMRRTAAGGSCPGTRVMTISPIRRTRMSMTSIPSATMILILSRF